MSQIKKPKSENLHLRIASDDKSLIQHAAHYKGYDDVSDYIRTNILEVAKKDIKETDHELTLTDDEWHRFKKIMEDPEEINENLLRAFQELDAIESH
ncbi:MAG: DUF1778 domain-containing protein [Chlamydiales bacterium]|nr:DUF1778 domain-containing protein [Chlamydiales bacterium]